jgi:uncharacterized phage infection (PIP) family protein YhgE
LPPPLPQLPNTLSQLPNTLPQLPDAFPQLPNNLQLPNTLSQLPNALSQLPNALSQLPNTLSQLPNTLSQLPNALPQLPNTLSQLPNALPQLPNTLPDTDIDIDIDDHNKKWSSAEMDIILEWMRAAKNMEKYKKKPKSQTYRELSTLLPDKDERRIKNKLDMLEKKYKLAKAQTKKTGWGVLEDNETIKSWIFSYHIFLQVFSN